jgi:flagellar hook-associated protein 3 FlgL
MDVEVECLTVLKYLKAVTVVEVSITIVDAVDRQRRVVLRDVRDLDYAEALSRLSQELFGLDAAQQAFARAQNLSLFRYL